MGFYLAGQDVTSSLGGIIARGRRTTVGGSNTGTETGVLRIDDAAILSGRAYEITVNNVNIDTTVADDEIHLRIRHTTDGSTPTTSSAVLPGGTVRITADDATFTPILPIVCYHFPASNQTLSLLLTCQRVNGTGTTAIFADGTGDVIDMVIKDIGVDPGDSGVDI